MKIYWKRFISKKRIVWIAASLSIGLIITHPYIGLPIFIGLGLLTFLYFVWLIAQKSGF